jgi:nucleolar protein TMA23
MDSNRYLKSFGWKEGEALQKGGIKRPILVKHKNDKKGIGHQPSGGVDAWWERLFDGQLKAFDVKEDETGLSFKQEKFVASGLTVSDSPLYRMFVRGETLGGTQGKVEILEFKRNSNGLATTDFTQLKTTFNKNGSKDLIHDESNEDDTRISKKPKEIMEMDEDTKRKKQRKNVGTKSDTKERTGKKEKKEKKVNSNNEEKLENEEKLDRKRRSEKKEKIEKSRQKIKHKLSEKKRKRSQKPEKVKGEKVEKEKSIEKSSKKRKVADEESSETKPKKSKKSKK